MFDSVLSRGAAPKSRFGAGTILSIGFHVVLVGGALWLSTRPAAVKEEISEVKFFAAAPAPPPPPPPPPPPAGGQQHQEKKTEKKPIKKPDTIVQPKEIPEEKPPEADPTPDPPSNEPAGQVGGQVGGQEGGTVGGQVGGVIGGTVGGTVGNQLEIVPFGEGMSRPEFDRAEVQRRAYTREALEARVEGVMIVKCNVLADGTVKNCRMIKPLPFLSESVLKILEGTKVTPATFEGHPVAIDYVFNFKFVLSK